MELPFLPVALSWWYPLVLTALVVYIASIVAQSIYNIFISPLASLPGPRLAAVSDAWFQWHALRFRRVLAMHDASQKYGPVVRIGPRKVLVAKLEDVITVYKTHRFRKSHWWDVLRFGGEHNTLSTPDPELHAVMRKWSAPAFRKDSLRSISAPIREVLRHFVERVVRESTGGRPIEVLHLFKALALDILGIALFGLEFGQMKTGHDHSLGRDVDNFLVAKGLESYLPGGMHRLLKFVPSPTLRRVLSAEGKIYELASGVYDSSEINDGHVNIIATCKAYRDPKTGLSPTKQQAISDAAIFLSAGTDTSSIALTYIAWHLARSPDFVKELRAELSNVSEYLLDDLDTLRTLPYLNAFIKEVLRVHGAASVPIERVVPCEGAFFQGHFLPGGTLIQSQGFTIHRDPTYFPDPLTILPERWVQRKNPTGWEERDVHPDVAAAWMPFMFGARACVGRPLAEMVLLMATVTLVRCFRIVPSEETTVDSMRPIDIAVILPAAKRCLLHFELDTTLSV